MSEKIEILEKKADKLWREEKWDEFILAVTELINYQDGHDEAKSRCNLGYVYIMKNNFDCACKEFNIAAKKIHL